MNIFETRDEIIHDYKSYINSFINIKDQRISQVVDESMKEGILCPEPLIQFNPNFKTEKKLAELCKGNFLHPSLNKIFKGYNLYTHQVNALTLGINNKDFVVTSGTGSGKSLTYIGTIFDRILNQKSDSGNKGIKAIIVYPMNALINSQTKEFDKYRETYVAENGDFPISYAQYTGQEKQQIRDSIRANPPDILLTNYMMLELIMTRDKEQPIRESFLSSLQFLVFDELHTYRGRQGSDVSMLIRRIKAYSENNLQCIGTSATMSSGEGTLSSQKQEVADIASLIFGSPFTTDQIIGETLQRVTEYTGSIPSQAELSKSIRSKLNNLSTEQQLKTHPLAIWLENAIGLVEKEGILIKGKPLTLNAVVQQLSDYCDLPLEECKSAIKSLLESSETINIQLKSNGIRRAYFPFRLHQFISQTGSVFLSLENPGERTISLNPGYYVNDDKGEKKIFPTVFSRITGHEFICVRKDLESGHLVPRFFTDTYDDSENLQSGYIIPQHASEEDLWNDNMIESLPDAWYRINKSGRKIDKKYAFRIPQVIYYDATGKYGEDDFDGATRGWYMPTSLLFDPTCGMFYDSKTRESAKLMQLGNEGRSTATTTLALASVEALQKAKLPSQDQKILSFTDNRQDASLQSGHYNDFVNVGYIRGAIYKALTQAPNQKLNLDQIAEYVFKALDLPHEAYAIRPQDNFRVKRENEEALKDYLTIRILQDLKRGWRYTMPNLEQCGLLNISFRYLKESAEDEDRWNQVGYIKHWSVEDRMLLIADTLNFLRTSKAINHRYLNNESRLVESRIKEKLLPDWGLSKDDRIEKSAFARFTSIGKVKNFPSVSAGKTSNWGKYISNTVTVGDQRLSMEDFHDFATQFFSALEYFDFVKSEELIGDKGTGRGYAVNADMIQWQLGDGVNVDHDRVRLRAFKSDFKIRANEYFKEFYSRKALNLGNARGAEHTGQISNADRKEREKLFRAGEISTLFCSPTMELGVDISNLNIVHLRNVPPSPANYAQRSGRAGRSGQGALVITYCSQFSAHDRNYFVKKSEMIDGVVRTPRISLENMELLESHIHAMYLLEAQLPITNRIMDTLDLSQEALPIKVEQKQQILANLPRQKDRLISRLKSMLGNDETLTNYISISKIEKIIDNIPESFEAAFERWRHSYRNVESTRAEANEVISNPIISASSQEKKDAKRSRYFAERQLELLKNDTDGFSNSFSEFYPFRYLASEGWLPGYNFTKLPIRLAMNNDGHVEYLSRPRLIALSEFGPRNLIYHNGSTYEVKKLQVNDIEGSKEKAKIAVSSGYILLEDEYDSETCPITNTPLEGKDRVEFVFDMLPMTESIAEARNKINCEEEERMRQGYDINTYFYLPAGKKAYNTIKVKSDEENLLDILYMPAAKIVRVNKKWRRSERDSFIIGKNSGYWKKEADAKKDDEENTGNIVKARLYTDYTADALYVQPTAMLNISEKGIITLNYAIKRAIEEIYQIENSELATTLMGGDESKNIFIYEAAEGSIGVLSQIKSDKNAFNVVINKAYEICFFKDGEDVKKEATKASYDDLLSYYNQRDHDKIDRFEIKAVLEQLMLCKVELQVNSMYDSYEDQYKELLNTYDQSSSTELKFLKQLYDRGLRLPDMAQPALASELGLYIQPDFQYDDSIYIFCDGSPHDNEEVRSKDRRQRRMLRDKGKTVLAWHYMEDLSDFISEHAELFIQVKDKS